MLYATRLFEKKACPSLFRFCSFLVIFLPVTVLTFIISCGSSQSKESVSDSLSIPLREGDQVVDKLWNLILESIPTTQEELGVGSSQKLNCRLYSTEYKNNSRARASYLFEEGEVGTVDVSFSFENEEHTGFGTFDPENSEVKDNILAVPVRMRASENTPEKINNSSTDNNDSTKLHIDPDEYACFSKSKDQTLDELYLEFGSLHSGLTSNNTSNPKLKQKSRCWRDYSEKPLIQIGAIVTYIGVCTRGEE